MTDEILDDIKKKKIHFINGRINGCPRNPENPFVRGKKNTIKLRKQCKVEVAKQRINGRQRIIEKNKQKQNKKPTKNQKQKACDYSSK